MRHPYEEARSSGLPRVDGPIVLVDGRRLQVAEWGRQDETPAAFLRGSPGSRWVGNFRIGDIALEHRLLDCRSDDVEVADGDQ